MSSARSIRCRLFKLKEHLASPNTRGFAAEHDGLAVGYVLYSRFRRSVRIDRIAVVPDYRRMRLASEMMSTLTMDIEAEYDVFLTYVREDNLDALLFFRFFGFVSRPPYLTIRDDSGLDFVKMRFVHD